MSSLIKQSSAQNATFFMVTSQDSITGLTGATVTVTISKNGAAFASPIGTVTEIGLGWYYIGLTSADTGTLGDILIHATAAGADPTDTSSQVVLDLPGATVTTVTGNVNGSTGSVFGAVGSVTGNVGGSIGGSVVGSVGSVTGNVGGSVASVTATVSANIISILGSAISGTASQISSAFSTFFNVATGTGTVNNTPTVGSVTGSVASVTGAVGSVTAGVSLATSQVPFKKNTALSGFTFPMFSSSGAPLTGLTVSGQRTIDGGTIGNCANSISEVSNGFYKINLAATDLNGNSISFIFIATGAAATTFTAVTQ